MSDLGIFEQEIEKSNIICEISALEFAKLQNFVKE